MSSDPDFDPFADASGVETIPEPTEEKTTVADSNEISVTFKAHGGFDAPWVVARGSADYLADLFKVRDFDGRISTLMNRVAEIDSHYKKVIGGDSGKG